MKQTERRVVHLARMTMRAFPAMSRLGKRVRRLDKTKPSKARELFARKVVVPIAKKSFGDRLAGVILVGSPQVGVRLSRPTSTLKSVRDIKQSDVDVVIVEKPSKIRDMLAGLDSFKLCERQIKKAMIANGIRFNADIMHVRLKSLAGTKEAAHQLLRKVVPTDSFPFSPGVYRYTPYQVIEGKELARGYRMHVSRNDILKYKTKWLKGKARSLRKKLEQEKSRKKRREYAAQLESVNEALDELRRQIPHDFDFFSASQ